MASMRGHGGSINLDDLQKERTYDYGRAYDDTKLANLLLAFECDRRSRAAGWGVTSIAAHPGVARTNIVLDGPGPDTPEGWRFRFIPMMWEDPAKAALPILYAGTSPQAHGGGYYGPQGVGGITGSPGVTSVPQNAQDPDLAIALWTALEQLAQVSFA
jgi:NAD(P)-dependent dehydrogenase (short-subunit alcohol dehydrogenase family)